MNLSSITKILVRLSEIRFDCSSLSSTGLYLSSSGFCEFDFVRLSIVRVIVCVIDVYLVLATLCLRLWTTRVYSISYHKG